MHTNQSQTHPAADAGGRAMRTWRIKDGTCYNSLAHGIALEEGGGDKFKFFFVDPCSPNSAFFSTGSGLAMFQRA